jgi:RNA polymerase sigma-70 factor (ECF subfamily)
MFQVQEGLEEAHAELYNRYASAVYSIALQMLGDPAEAQDTTHDVFVNLWLRAGTFHPERGAIRGWILAVAHHLVVDRIRQQRRARNLPDGTIQDAFSNVGSIAEQVVEGVTWAEGQQRVRWALDTLPAEQREVVELAYYQGFSQSQISERLRQPRGTITERMRLGFTRLRGALGPYGAFGES